MSSKIFLFHMRAFTQCYIYQVLINHIQVLFKKISYGIVYSLDMIEILAFIWENLVLEL